MAYHAKGRDEDERHADHVDGHVDRVMVVGAILGEARVSALSAGSGEGIAYKGQVPLQIQRHCGGGRGGRGGLGGTRDGSS